MIKKFLFNKYFAYTLIFFAGFSAVIILFSMFDGNENMENDKTDISTPVTQTTQDKSTENSKNDTSTKQKDMNKNLSDKGSQTVKDEPENRSIPTDDTEWMSELQSMFADAINNTSDSESDNSNEGKSDSDSVRELDSMSQALNKAFSSDLSDKESYDALDELFNLFEDSDNPELRKFASLVPRDIDGKPITFWEAHQRYKERMKRQGLPLNE